ncbi:MAG: exodeoxyribonuclease V subunit alpha [Myxococcota bacterium]
MSVLGPPGDDPTPELPAPGDLPRLDPGGSARLAVEGGARLSGRLVDAAAALELDLGELALGAELADWQGLEGLRREGFVLLVAALRLAEARGSTRLPLGAGLAEVLAGFAVPAEVRDAATALAPRLAELTEVAGPPEAGRPLVVADPRLAGGFLSAGRAHRLERRVAAHLARLAGAAAQDLGPPAALDAALADVLGRPAERDGVPLRPSDEQARAIRAACVHPVAVIAGGPGTGKTTIVASVLRALVRLGVDAARIALAAPTGKAADRMRQALEAALRQVPEARRAAEDRQLAGALPPALTLHRLLGWSPSLGRYRQHEGSPLAAQVVIVDEGSMVDLAMFDRLLRAMPLGARLVLLGDADQLPSVDAGAVFRDLGAAFADGSGGARAFTLSRSYRMDPRDPAGRHVLLAARAVNAGAAGTLLGAGDAALRRVSPAEATFTGAEHVAAADRPALLERWARARALAPEELTRRVVSRQGETFGPEERAFLRSLLDRLLASRVLAVTRGRRTGAVALNRFFHARAAARAGVPPGRLLPGEPVLVTRNDYERGLFNGDQGVVLDVRLAPGEAPRRSAVFARGEGFVAFPLGGILPQLERAYATTVHKAQGSEHRSVVLVLPDAPLPLLTRELLYTGLTRARKGALVLGDPAVFRVGVRRRALRASGLADQLAQAEASATGAVSEQAQ